MLSDVLMEYQNTQGWTSETLLYLLARFLDRQEIVASSVLEVALTEYLDSCCGEEE